MLDSKEGKQCIQVNYLGDNKTKSYSLLYNDGISIGLSVHQETLKAQKKSYKLPTISSKLQVELKIIANLSYLFEILAHLSCIKR